MDNFKLTKQEWEWVYGALRLRLATMRGRPGGHHWPQCIIDEQAALIDKVGLKLVSIGDAQ